MALYPDAHCYSVAQVGDIAQVALGPVGMTRLSVLFVFVFLQRQLTAHTACIKAWGPIFSTTLWLWFKLGHAPHGPLVCNVATVLGSGLIV